jgi:hypothetical protein
MGRQVLGYFFKTDLKIEFKISWLSQIIQNPDVFNLCGYPHASVNVGCCKVPPDETNKHLAIWKCLDLLDILFRLAECPTVTTDVFNMIKTPMTTYPDILTLGVVQINVGL